MKSCASGQHNSAIWRGMPIPMWTAPDWRAIIKGRSRSCLSSYDLGNSLATFRIFSLFACWFQPAQISQSTVFFSHNKPALASPNQPRNQPTNTPNVCFAAVTFTMKSLVGHMVFLVPSMEQRISTKTKDSRSSASLVLGGT